MRFLRALGWFLGLWLIALVVLPVAYRFINPPFSTPMLWRYATLQRVEHRFVPLSAMTQGTAKALIGTEDARFCRHRGIDWGELRAAFSEEGGPSRGASTITMQLVRNLMLYNGGGVIFGGLRKLVEVPLALYAELVMPKHRILELYLNYAELGPDGEFGIAAGSQKAFSRHPEELTDSEAALLMGILANPREFSAKNPGPHARRRAAMALARGQGADSGCLK